LAVAEVEVLARVDPLSLIILSSQLISAARRFSDALWFQQGLS
jgi:hypothetical protein